MTKKVMGQAQLEREITRLLKKAEAEMKMPGDYNDDKAREGVL